MLTSPHHVHASEPSTASPWLRAVRWLEVTLLLGGIAWAMLGCTSGTHTGDTMGRGVGAVWSGISGDPRDIARGQAMGRSVGGWVGSASGVDSDRQLRQSRGSGFTW